MTDETELYYLVNYPNAYEGATLTYKDATRQLLEGESDTLAQRELRFLRQRSEHAIRNNGYAKIAANKFITNMGFVSVQWKTAKGKKHTQMQEIWEDFISNPCLDGYGDFKTYQSICNNSLFETGTAFSRFQFRNTGSKIPLKLQPIPTSLHDIDYMGDPTDLSKITRFGITFEDTKPSFYHFKKSILEQPNNLIPFIDRVDVPASEIIHYFLRSSPGQWLGLPFLTSVLITLYQLDELVDATLNRQTAAQAIAWIIENTNPSAMTGIGSPLITKPDGVNPKVVFKAQGGNIQYLNRGEKLNLVQSADIGNNLDIMIRSQLEKIAATLDVPFHSMTGNTSGLNFSSIRAIGLELRTRIEYILNFYSIPLSISPIANKVYSLSKLYYPKIGFAYPQFNLPRFYEIDALKDTQAELLDLQSGFTTLERILDKRHLEFEDIVEDRKRMEQDGLGEILTAGNASMNQANNTQANSNSSSN